MSFVLLNLWIVLPDKQND